MKVSSFNIVNFLAIELSQNGGAVEMVRGIAQNVGKILTSESCSICIMTLIP